MAELHDLFCKKLQQCCVLFDFLDCVADLKGKEIKRAALNELVESVATSRGVLIEPLYPEAIKMVRAEGRESQGLKNPGDGESMGGRAETEKTDKQINGCEEAVNQCRSLEHLENLYAAGLIHDWLDNRKQVA